MERRLDNKNTAAAKATTHDIKIVGDPDVWKLICKASSESQGWMKSTKRMDVEGGYLTLVTTEHRDPETGAVVACAEALVFHPSPSTTS